MTDFINLNVCYFFLPVHGSWVVCVMSQHEEYYILIMRWLYQLVFFGYPRACRLFSSVNAAW